MIDKEIYTMTKEEKHLYGELEAQIRLNQELKNITNTCIIEDILDKEFKLVHYGVRTKSFGYKNNA